MLTNLSNISVQQLKRAVTVREQIEELELELANILGKSSTASHSTEISSNGHTGRRKMSASARAKIAAAQRARWAKRKQGKVEPVAVKGKRKMSASARAKIAAAARAR